MRRVVWLPLATSFLLIAPSDSAVALTVRDITPSTGLAATQETWTVDTLDYDNDGLMDAWIGYHDHGGKLWHNDGDGTMSWVARSAWPEFESKSSLQEIDRHGSAWGDINGDGLIDAYSTVGRRTRNLVKNGSNDDELWIQGPVGTFKDIGTQMGVGDPYGRGRSAVMFDADGDGRLDLYVLNEKPRPDDPNRTTLGQNRLFLNVRDATAPNGFRLVPAPAWGLDRYLGYGWAGMGFDQNRDGRADVLLTGRARLYLFRNTGGSFVDASTAVGLATGHVQDVERADVDGDGRLDLIELSASSVSWQQNLGPTFDAPRTIGTFTDGVSAAVGDADGDGLVDVYALRSSQTSNPPDLLYLNRSGSWPVMTMPAMAGHGTDVAALRLWPNRPPVFVVLNGGWDTAGPVKVLQLTRT
jgi:VCBS repeat protein